MNSLINASVVMLLFIPLAIFLRFLDLGLNMKSSIQTTFIFPFRVSYIHFGIFKKLYYDKKIKAAFKFLIMPITDLPQVIISIAEMEIEKQAKLMAVQELLSELSDKDIKKLIVELRKKHGITVVRHKSVDKLNKYSEFLNAYKYNTSNGLENLFFKSKERSIMNFF